MKFNKKSLATLPIMLCLASPSFGFVSTYQFTNAQLSGGGVADTTISGTFTYDDIQNTITGGQLQTVGNIPGQQTNNMSLNYLEQLGSTNIFVFENGTCFSDLSFATGELKWLEITCTYIDFAASHPTPTLYHSTLIYSRPLTLLNPTANPGAGGPIKKGTLISLDGSGSSDTQGNPLSYAWTLTGPSGSNAVLSSATTVNPQFTPDVFGDYTVSLVVTDTVTTLQSRPVSITFSETNTAPTADAGPNQTTAVDGTSVSLNGIAFDPDGDPLTVQWTVVSAPTGSNITSAPLVGQNLLMLSFTPDAPGNYVLQLVANDGYSDSLPSQVTITSANLPPIAEAGPDQSITLDGSTVQLDGSQSYDPDGDTFTYAWSFTNKPANSTAAFSDPTNPKPTFVADVHSTTNYTAQLIVTDQWGLPSTPSTVNIGFNEIAPVANAGLAQSTVVGTTVTLNGSASSDANGDPLTYAWSVAVAPVGSKAKPISSTLLNPTFTPDVPGTYQLQLFVNDGFVNSPAATVSVTAISVQTEAVQNVQTCQTLIAGLPRSAFINDDLQKSLARSLNDVIEDIDEQEYREALSEVNSDLTKKLDGCSAPNATKPDRDDWFKTCQVETQVYNCLKPVATELTGLAATQPKPKDNH